jgi:hypothetical protein
VTIGPNAQIPRLVFILSASSAEVRSIDAR